MTFHPFCLLGFHKPKKSLLWSDGKSTRAPCRRCGRELLRRRSGWVLADKADVTAAK